MVKAIMNNSTTPSSPPIDTAKVAKRRMLHFSSIDEMMAEVDRLAMAEKAGQLKRLGNWTLGQTLGHLAAWSEFGYDGYPSIKVPFFIRWILRMRKRRFIVGPMPAGVKIPGIPGGTLATEPMSVEEALPRLRRVMERLHVECPPVPSPAVGRLTHAESIAMTLRHAELHLGFFVFES
jgi:hypothetical protein